MELEERELAVLRAIVQEERLVQLKAENLKLRKQNAGLEIEKRLQISLERYSLDMETGELTEI